VFGGGNWIALPASYSAETLLAAGPVVLAARSKLLSCGVMQCLCCSSCCSRSIANRCAECARTSSEFHARIYVSMSGVRCSSRSKVRASPSAVQCVVCVRGDKLLIQDGRNHWLRSAGVRWGPALQVSGRWPPCWPPPATHLRFAP
jgi:hypothetical protein